MPNRLYIHAGTSAGWARNEWSVALDSKTIYEQLEARLYAELPIVLLYQRSEVAAFTDRLRGRTTSLSTTWWNVGAWSLAP